MNPFRRLLALAAVSALPLAAASAAAGSLTEIPLKDIDGKDTTLRAQPARVLLVVNVASKCGLTPQYTALEKLHRQYKDKGFSVVGVPSNDFNGQEPGTAEEIKGFCKAKYDVTFPLMAKVSVKGPEQHPLYAALTGQDSPFPGEVKWNFGKFLVSADGKILARFEPRTAPDAPEVTKAIEAALAAK
jgi:glutathione peroxidase